MVDAVEFCNDEAAVEILEQRPKFGLLLDTARQLRLRDAALKMFSNSVHREDKKSERLVANAVQHLHKALQCPANELERDVQAQADACHGAWVICAALAIATPTVLAAATATLPSDQGRRLIDQVAFIVGALCLEGPATLRPALLPCIGLLVQGRGHLFSLHPCLLEGLRAGLRSPSRALRGRTVQCLVEILSKPNNVADTNSVARQLVVLHPELVSLLSRETSRIILMQTLSAFEALAISGSPVPVSAVPHVFAESFAPAGVKDSQESCQTCIAVAQRCLLQIVSNSPESFHGSLAAALRRFKEMCSQWEAAPGELLRSHCSNSLQMATLFASLRGYLRDEWMQHCGLVLKAELGELYSAGAESICSVWAAELIFILIDGLGLGKDFINPDWFRIEKYPTFGSCVATLVWAALQELASVDSADTSLARLEVSSKLANALEDLEEFELPTEGDVRRLVAYHWPTSKTAETQVCKLLETVIAPADSTTIAEAAEEKPNLPCELPWFAEYDTARDKWTCRICAEAGGHNPYAKGISIKRDQVPLRMRIHSGAAVHRRSAAARSEATEVSGVSAGSHESQESMIVSVPAGQDEGSGSAKKAAKRDYAVTDESSGQPGKQKRIRQSAIGGA
mmetsp:Transcript_28694/g.44861  ORF Transcript_28694/g.44861 Transcript_28694/m.44861 type:complete len:627 (+) Transcript_28694:60-1940(+)